MSTNIFTTAMVLDKLAKPSFAREFIRIAPNGTAPLFGLTSMLGEETAVQVEHGYFAKIMLFPAVTTYASTIKSDATNLTVLDSSNILPGMILQVSATSENMLVTAVPDATHVTVVRGVGTVTAADIPANTSCFQVGNASEEGSQAPQSLRIDPVRVINLTQIFRNSWSLTGTVEATDVIAGDSHLAENRTDCAGFHAADIEKALFFGQKYQGTRNGQPFRTMDGVISATTSTAYYPSGTASGSVSTAGSTTNYSQLEAMLDPVFNQTTNPSMANERVLFVGGQAMRVINQIGRLNGTYQIMEGQTSFGMQYSSFKIPRGTFRMIEHPLFNSNAVWSKMAIAIDLPSFKLAYLNGRKTMNKEYNSKGQEYTGNAIDATGGTLTTECTAVFKNPSANAVITNLTAGAAG
jgi:hypothetical protein